MAEPAGTRAKQLIHRLIRLGVAIREEARMNIRYHVKLSEAERCELTALVGSGKHYARKIKRAQILLAADGGLSDDDIAAAVAVGGSTVYRTKRRFVEGNLEAALNEEPRAGADRKLTSNEEAPRGAHACSRPPWRMSSISMPRSLTRSGQRSASTKAPPSSLIGEARQPIPAAPGRPE